MAEAEAAKQVVRGDVSDIRLTCTFAIRLSVDTLGRCAIGMLVIERCD